MLHKGKVYVLKYYIMIQALENTETLQEEY